MSRAKKARARERRLAAASPPPRASARSAPRPRLQAARRRIALAKVGVVGVAIVGFGGALTLSRLSYSGHAKEPLKPLAAPPRYVEIVRRNLLEAGVVGPAQAPPGAATASS